VAYGSHSLTDAERKWSSMEKECFAVVHFMNHWWHLLVGAQFEVLTDHQALSKMFGQAESPTGKLARWVSKIQPFKPFNVKCWSGSNTPYGAMLGRAPPSEDRVATELIPMDKRVQELHIAQEEAR